MLADDDSYSSFLNIPSLHVYILVLMKDYYDLTILERFSYQHHSSTGVSQMYAAHMWMNLSF